MTGTESRRREVFQSPDRDYGNVLEVGFVFDNSVEREKQHLIEDKIDRLFDEVRAIMYDGGDINEP